MSQAPNQTKNQTKDQTPPKPAAARAVADLTAGTILATVDIAVPPDRVFQALTSDEVTRWWGSPDTYTTTEWSADLRVGGRWRAAGTASDGRPFTVEGEYLAIDRPALLVHSWRADWDQGHDTTVTYRLEAIPGGTRLTLRHDGFAGRPDAQRGHTSGWERVLGWLAGHLTPAPAAPGRFFLCKLYGPRPSFPADMTGAEGRAMHEHVAYWHRLLGEGTAIVFGPVADPTGVWGLGVVEVPDEAALAALAAADPTVRSGLGFRLETLPMLQAVVRR
jgi:uncharacterized protein YndB with AHSA1/START domain